MMMYNQNLSENNTKISLNLQPKLRHLPFKNCVEVKLETPDQVNKYIEKKHFVGLQ